MANSNKVPDFLKMATDIKRNASRYAATEAEKFFKNCITKGGFTDVSFIAYKKTSNPLAGNRTLYKSGELQRSIRKQLETEQRVIIQSDLSYSAIQNNGGYITVTAQMKKFFWAKYIEFAGIKKHSGRDKTNWKDKTNLKYKKNGELSQSKKNLKTNSKAEFCKAMALRKVGSKIKIEQRQFMGESKYLMRSFESWFSGHVEVVFKDNLNGK